MVVTRAYLYGVLVQGVASEGADPVGEAAAQAAAMTNRAPARPGAAGAPGRGGRPPSTAAIYRPAGSGRTTFERRAAREIMRCWEAAWRHRSTTAAGAPARHRPRPPGGDIGGIAGACPAGRAGERHGDGDRARGAHRAERAEGAKAAMIGERFVNRLVSEMGFGEVPLAERPTVSVDGISRPVFAPRAVIYGTEGWNAGLPTYFETSSMIGPTRSIGSSRTTPRAWPASPSISSRTIGWAASDRPSGPGLTIRGRRCRTSRQAASTAGQAMRSSRSVMRSMSSPSFLTIQKVGADPRYLARDGGWRADPEPLQPIRVDRQESRTLIYVGPDIVDYLDDDQRLRVGSSRPISPATLCGPTSRHPQEESEDPSSSLAPGRQPLPRSRRRSKDPRSRTQAGGGSSLRPSYRRDRLSGIRCGGCSRCCCCSSPLAAERPTGTSMSGPSRPRRCGTTRSSPAANDLQRLRQQLTQ